MQLKFASYNIHKAVGTDRRRDPDRILAVLREIDADIIALQEVDLRKDRGAPVPALVVVGSGLNRIGDRSDEAAGILV